MKCPHCNKIYISKGCYEKHRKVCKWQQQPQKNASNEELCEIVQFLLKKCDNLEKELSKIKQNTQSIVKRSCLDILNSSPTPRLRWDEYVSRIELNMEDLLFVMREDFEKGFMKIIEKYFTEENMPFYSFTQQEKIIYIYTSQWIKIQSIHMSKWMNYIQSKLCVLLKEWCLTACKKEMENYDKYTRCVYAFNFDNNALLSSLQRKIYTLLKK